MSCGIFCCLDKAAPHVGMLAARLAARLAAVTAADAGARDSDADALFEALPAISGRSGQALRQQVIALQGDVDELTMDVVAERALPGLGHCRDLTHRPLHGCRSMKFRQKSVFRDVDPERPGDPTSQLSVCCFPKQFHAKQSHTDLHSTLFVGPGAA